MYLIIIELSNAVYRIMYRIMMELLTELFAYIIELFSCCIDLIILIICLLCDQILVFPCDQIFLDVAHRLVAVAVP